MFLRYGPILAAVVLAQLNCTSTGPETSPLEGGWATEREALSPAGSYQNFLTFDTRTFTAEVRTFGLAAGQGPNDLHTYEGIEGRFRVEGDRLYFEPVRLITWHHSFAPTSSGEVRSPYPWGSIFDDARFTLGVSEFTLRYVTYPADAPVPTTRTYWRLTPALQN